MQVSQIRGLAGLKNGELLSAAETASFDVLITADRNIPNQQNLDGRKISILIFCAPTNRLRDLLLLVVAANDALESIGQGKVVTIRQE